MLLLHRPTAGELKRFLAHETASPFDFSGAQIDRTAPAGYTRDHACYKLGHGEQVFAAACQALAAWKHFHLGWLEAWPTSTPIQTGATVAIVIQVGPLWWLNACRIVEVFVEVFKNGADAHDRYGFTYRTLPRHVERGEERFSVERNRDTGAVWYDITAVSRPWHFLARLGYPCARVLQRRFARESAAGMRRAVAAAVAGSRAYRD